MEGTTSYSAAAQRYWAKRMRNKQGREPELKPEHEIKERPIEILADPDDVQVPRGRDTVGLELEFLVATNPVQQDWGELHPGEDRWQARMLYGEEPEQYRYLFTCRNTIIDALRQLGIPCIKDPLEYHKLMDGHPFFYYDNLESRAPAGPYHDKLLREWHPRWDMYGAGGN
ncbi:hypothetical protein F4778DRAFT_84355 [Xylariomycetidae sp. FL2044]|nr:hypothetical protein F4778DRAFT_84355 [Xylariomycetidae sp. FL2044]